MALLIYCLALDPFAVAAGVGLGLCVGILVGLGVRIAGR